MTTPKRPAIFIEKIFPVKLLNEQVYYEHGGNPFKGLHRWYSRKPLSFSRASVLGSILPADISIAEFEYLLGLYSEQEFEFWQKRQLSKEDLEKIRDSGKVRLYKTPPTEKQIERVQDLCEQVWGKRTPAILDPFAGGGSIPFEAARYGLEVFASDLNPVAVVTMKAAMEYPLKFGPSLQVDIDKWVKWVGDEAEKRLAEFFPCPPSPNAGGEVETIQNYLWAHTLVCPSCGSVVPLSPNWWLYKRPEKQNLDKWCAVKPIPNLAEKRVDFELIRGKKGKGTTIETETGEYNPDDFATISRSVGKCPNCNHVIEQEYVINYAQTIGLEHQMYAVAYKKGKSSLQFRIPTLQDIEGYQKGINKYQEILKDSNLISLVPQENCSDNPQYMMAYRYGLTTWDKYFNPRQLVSLVTYLEIINDAKLQLQAEYELEKVEAISIYLALVMDRCADLNCRLNHWHSSRISTSLSSSQHSLNLNWNYSEINGYKYLWNQCADIFTSDYTKLCEMVNKFSEQSSIFSFSKGDSEQSHISLSSADSLYHIPDNSLDSIITDPPYYDTIPYAEISDFFYV